MRTSLLAWLAVAGFGAAISSGPPVITPGTYYGRNTTLGTAYSGYQAGLPNSGALNGQAPAPVTARQGANGALNTVAGLTLNWSDGMIVSASGGNITIGAGTGERCDIAYVMVGIEGGAPQKLTQRTQNPLDKTIGYRFQVASNPITKKDGWAVGWADIVPFNGYARRIYFRVLLNTYGSYKPVVWYADAVNGTDVVGQGTGPGTAACKTLSRAAYNAALALISTSDTTGTRAAGCFYVQYATGCTYVEDFNLPQQSVTIPVEFRPTGDTAGWGNPPSASAGRASVTRTHRVAMDGPSSQDWVPPLKGVMKNTLLGAFYNLDVDQVNCPSITMGASGGNATYKGLLYNCTFPNAPLATQPYLAPMGWYAVTGASQGTDFCFPNFALIGCSGSPYAVNQSTPIANCNFTNHCIDFLAASFNSPSSAASGSTIQNTREFYDALMTAGPIQKIWRDTANQRVLVQIQPTQVGYVSFVAIPKGAKSATYTLPDGITTTSYTNNSTSTFYLAQFWADATSQIAGYHGSSYQFPVTSRYILGDGNGTVFTSGLNVAGLNMGPALAPGIGATASDTTNIAALAASGKRVAASLISVSEGKPTGYSPTAYVLSGAAKPTFAFDTINKPTAAWPTSMVGDYYASGALTGIAYDSLPYIMITKGARETLGDLFESSYLSGASNYSATCKITSSSTGITTADQASGATGNHRLLPISRVMLTTYAYLQMTTQPVAGDALTVVYGGQSFAFTFQSTVATPATQIQIGSSVSATLANLLAFLQSSNSGLAGTNTFSPTSDGTAILCNVTSKTGSAVYGNAKPGSSAWTLPASGAITAYSPYADCGVPSSPTAAPWVSLSDFDPTTIQPWLKPGFTDYAGNSIQVTSESYAQLYPPIPSLAWYEPNSPVSLVPATPLSATGAFLPAQPVCLTTGLAPGDWMFCGVKQHPDLQQFGTNYSQASAHENPVWMENNYWQTLKFSGNFQRAQSNNQNETAWGTVTVLANSAAVQFNAPNPGLNTMTLTPKSVSTVGSTPIQEIDGSLTYTQTITWNEPSASAPLYYWNNNAGLPANPRIGVPNCGNLFLQALSGTYAGQLFQIISQTATTTTIVLPVAMDGNGNQITPNPITFASGDSYQLPPPFQQQQVLSLIKTVGNTINDRAIVQSDANPMVWTATRAFTYSASAVTWAHKQNTRSWINHAVVYDVVSGAATEGQGHVDYFEIQCTDMCGIGSNTMSIAQCGFIDGTYNINLPQKTSGLSGYSIQSEPELTFRGSQIAMNSTAIGTSDPAILAGIAANSTAQTAYHINYLQGGNGLPGTNTTVTSTQMTFDGGYNITGGVTQVALGLQNVAGAALGSLMFPWDANGAPRTSMRPGAMN